MRSLNFILRFENSDFELKLFLVLSQDPMAELTNRSSCGFTSRFSEWARNCLNCAIRYSVYERKIVEISVLEQAFEYVLLQKYCRHIAAVAISGILAD
jgi:hypothetical protein